MVTLLDVTLRDGGYVNQFSFGVQDCCGVAAGLRASGLAFVEIGYFMSVAGRADALGRIGYSLEHLASISASCKPETQTVVMTPLGASVEHKYASLAQAGVRVVRIPVTVEALAQAEGALKAAHMAGLLVSLNLVRISEYSPRELIAATTHAASLGPDWLYLADSNGALYPQQVKEIFAELKKRVGVPLGFHPHDGLHLAFANSLAAIEEGIAFLDSSLGGLGKGGNLPTELIAMYLNATTGFSFKLRPMISATQKYLLRWLDEHWSIRLKDAMSSVANLNHQALLAIRERSCGDTWKSIHFLLERLECESFRKQEIGA